MNQAVRNINGWFVSFETPSIQKYLFATNNLKEIRGASALVEDIHGEKTRTLIEKCGGEIIFLGGSGGAAFFTDASRVDGFREQLEERFYRKTAFLFPHWAFFEGPRSLPLPEVFAELSRNKEPLTGSPHRGPNLSTALRYCESCYAFPAKTLAIQGNGLGAVCEVCERKQKTMRRDKKTDLPYVYGLFNHIKNGPGKAKGNWQKAASLFFEREQGALQTILPNETSEIGSGDQEREGYIALLYADANNLGAFFRVLQQASHQQGKVDPFAHYNKTSRDFREHAGSATYQAILETFKEGPKLERGKPLPLEILYLGGDDILIAVGADKAADLAICLGRCFQKTMTAISGTRALSLSIGIAYGRYKTPIHLMMNKAGECLELAKKRTAIEPGIEGAIAFDLTDRVPEFQRENLLTGNPYSLSELACILSSLSTYQSHEFAGRSQLEDLIQACEQGRNQGIFGFLSLLGRMRSDRADQVERFFKKHYQNLTGDGFDTQGSHDDQTPPTPWIPPKGARKNLFPNAKHPDWQFTILHDLRLLSSFQKAEV